MRTAVLAAVGAAVAAGCWGGGGDPGSPAADVALADADAAGFPAALAAHKGSVVLVDLWATWCGPCRESLPHTLELARKYAGAGLAVLTVSLDKPEDRDAAREFLRRQRATTENYFWTDRTRAGGEYLKATLGYTGMIPHLAVIGRDGKVAWTSGEAEGMTFSAVDRLVRDELGKR